MSTRPHTLSRARTNQYCRTLIYNSVTYEIATANTDAGRPRQLKLNYNEFVLQYMFQLYNLNNNNNNSMTNLFV